MNAELVVSADLFEKAKEGTVPPDIGLNWEALPNWLLIGRKQPLDIFYLPLVSGDLTSIPPS